MKRTKGTPMAHNRPPPIPPANNPKMIPITKATGIQIQRNNPRRMCRIFILVSPPEDFVTTPSLKNYPKNTFFLLGKRGCFRHRQISSLLRD